jgi:hypothetical protein
MRMLLLLCLVQVVDSFIGLGFMLHKGRGGAASGDTVAATSCVMFWQKSLRSAATELPNVLAEICGECSHRVA